MFYGIEVNEPYQVNTEYKLRCLVKFEKDQEFGEKPGWTPSFVYEKERAFDPKTGALLTESAEELEKPNPRAFAVKTSEEAEKIAELLPVAANAAVIPVEDGDVYEGERLEALGRTLTRQRRIAVDQSRQVR